MLKRIVYKLRNFIFMLLGLFGISISSDEDGETGEQKTILDGAFKKKDTSDNISKKKVKEKEVFIFNDLGFEVFINDDDIVVNRVYNDSIAYKMGMKEDDILLKVNGEKINTVLDIKDNFKMVNNHIDLKVLDVYGNKRELNLTVDEVLNDKSLSASLDVLMSNNPLISNDEVLNNDISHKVLNGGITLAKGSAAIGGAILMGVIGDSNTKDDKKEIKVLTKKKEIKVDNKKDTDKTEESLKKTDVLDSNSSLDSKVIVASSLVVSSEESLEEKNLKEDGKPLKEEKPSKSEGKLKGEEKLEGPNEENVLVPKCEVLPEEEVLEEEQEEEKEERKDNTKEQEALLLCKMLEEQRREEELELLKSSNQKETILRLLNQKEQVIVLPIFILRYRIVSNLFESLSLNNTLVSINNSLGARGFYHSINPFIFLSKRLTIDETERLVLSNLNEVSTLRGKIISIYGRDINTDVTLMRIMDKLDVMEEELTIKYDNLLRRKKQKVKKKLFDIKG